MSAQDARTPPAPRPAARRWFARGRSPGSHVLPHRLPGLTQWRVDVAARAYRCGGSSGFAFRAHRFPVSLRQGFLFAAPRARCADSQAGAGADYSGLARAASMGRYAQITLKTFAYSLTNKRNLFYIDPLWKIT